MQALQIKREQICNKKNRENSKGAVKFQKCGWEEFCQGFAHHQRLPGGRLLPRQELEVVLVLATMRKVSWQRRGRASLGRWCWRGRSACPCWMGPCALAYPHLTPSWCQPALSPGTQKLKKTIKCKKKNHCKEIWFTSPGLVLMVISLLSKVLTALFIPHKLSYTSMSNFMARSRPENKTYPLLTESI